MTKLTKGCIKKMIKDITPKKDFKPFLVQVYNIKRKTSNNKEIICMSISDSLNYYQAICENRDLKNYDVITVTDYKFVSMKTIEVIKLKDFKISYTDIDKCIGSPVKIEPKQDDDEIPISATVVEKDEEQVIVEDEKNEELIAEDEEETVKEGEKKNEPMEEEKIDESKMKGLRPIKFLTSYTPNWSIKARITYKKKVKSFKNKKNEDLKLLPLELIDNEGTSISATIYGNSVEEYNEILKEGKCYYFSHGKVKLADKRYTTVNNEYTLIFDELSEIKLAKDDFSTKFQEFNFTPIGKVAELPKGTNIDVLGIVKNVGPITTFTREGKESSKKVVTIYDESNELISITFWRDLVNEEISEFQIIGFKSLKVSEYYNKKQLNTTTDTIFKVNPRDNRLQILQLMVEKGVIPSELKKTYKEKISLIAEINNPEEQALIDSKGRYFTVNGTIIYISHEKGFFYIGCNNCRKKVQGDKCTNCEKDEGVKLIYNFTIQVSDGTSSIWVTVLGSEGEKLVGKTAEDLKTLKDRNENEYNAVFNSIRGKVMINIIISLFLCW